MEQVGELLPQVFLRLNDVLALVQQRPQVVAVLAARRARVGDEHRTKPLMRCPRP